MKQCKLIIDIGNTRTKLAIFRGKEVVKYKAVNKIFAERLANFLSGSDTIKMSLISSVSGEDYGIANWLSKKMNIFEFNSSTPLPVTNKYATPETLGADRIAGVIGATHLFPGKNILVIDAGSSITFDFINENREYLGGSIAPGLEMRFKALNHFTGRLPLVKEGKKPILYGNSTETAIRSGVQYGILQETQGIINAYNEAFPQLQVVLTGGDHSFFDKNLKNSIFVAPYLTLQGLNEILDYNNGH